MDPEGTTVKKKKQTKNKQQSPWKMHVNKLHTKLGHTGEDKGFRCHVTYGHQVRKHFKPA